MFGKMKRILNKFKRPKYYENCVDATYFIRNARKVFGASVFTVESTPKGRICSQFSYLGFVCFVFWHCAYFYCYYRIINSDQTILRSLYDTKLQRYGDEVERVSTLVYVLYAMWKLPFDVHIDCRYLQLLVDIDQAIEKMGENIDFTKCARLSFRTSFAKALINSARMLSVWASLSSFKLIPLEKVFQVIFSDTLALTTTAHYCLYLHLLRERYRIVNSILDSIEATTGRNLLLAVRSKSVAGATSTLQVQDIRTSARIKSCGKIYAMLHSASGAANNMFGAALALTMLMNIILIVLYLFYFMEATASGLFHDIQRYVDFLIYVMWQIGFSVGIIYLNIYFSESTVSEGKITSFVTHKIINSEINPLVRTEAVHLSLQVMHQLPVFTLHGLCRIDYMLLLEGSRTVVTFLVILLQFAADTH